MLYDDYRRKITKFAVVLNFIKRHRVAIICVLSSLLLAVSVLVGIRGMVYEIHSCPASVFYGDAVGYRADAVFGKVVYEYVEQEKNNWSETAPVVPGDYLVRAKSAGPFGTVRYGKTHFFSVVPRQTQVKASPSVNYGELPEVSADLAYEDKIFCDNFNYENISARETKVSPDVGSIKVINADGKDVTAFYSFIPVTSDIAFNRRKIEVTVQDKSGIYDGNPLMFDGYELSKNTPLAEGDFLIASFEAQRTEAGVTENIPQLRVVRENGIDVTGNYDIKITAGKLTVEKRPLYIKTGSAEKIYDGTLLFCDEFSVRSAEDKSGLLAGHIVTLTEHCYTSGAGSVQNLPLFSVYDGARDVTANYCVFYDAGMLTVKPREILVETEGGSWTYDGEMHTNTSFSVAESDGENGLISGHFVSIKEACYALDAGEKANEPQICVVDKDGTDVTGNYTVTYHAGILEILPRSVIICSADAEWVFDGINHAEAKFSLSSESLYDFVSGDSAIVTSSSEITEVGTAENRIVLCVSDENGRDVTDNYDFTYETGVLRITPRPITVFAGSAEKVYDGRALTSDDFVAQCEFGEALVKGHVGFSVNEGEQIDVGTGVNYARSFIVKDGTRDVTFNYDISYGVGSLTVTPRPIVVTSRSAEKIYDGTPLICNEYEVTCKYGFAVVEGQEISVEIIGNITDAVRSLNYISTVSITDGERDVTFNYAVEKREGTLEVLRRPVTVDVGNGRWVFDGEPHGVDTFSVNKDSTYDFLQEHNAVGYPASFIEDVGSAESCLNVYIFDKEEKDVTNNYEIKQNFGTLEVTPRPVTVRIVGGERIYNGEPLTPSATEYISEYTPAFVAKHEVYIETYGKQTDVGSTECGVGVLYVYDKSGNDKTFDYQITFETGTLTVTPRPVKFKVADVSQYYNGYSIYSSDTEVQPAQNDEGLLSWHTFFLQTTAFMKNVGKMENQIVDGSVIIYENYRDVTFNYIVSTESGWLEVLPRPILVQTFDAEKMYDGTPLVMHECTVCSRADLVSALAEGQILETEYSGSQTAVGFSQNTFKSLAIFDGSEDVTSNYDIEYDYGRLTVQIPDGQLTIATGSAEKVYDGTPLVCGEYALTNTLPEIYDVFVRVIGEITDVGTVSNRAEVKVTGAEGVDVTDIIKVTFDLGTLRVTRRTVVIETNSNSWPFDGRAHSDTGHRVSEISEYQLAEGEESIAVEYAFIIDVGVKENEQEIKIFDDSGRDKTDNYIIRQIFGFLEVTVSDYEDDGKNLDTSGNFGGGGGGEGGGDGFESIALKVNSSVGGMVYLRLMNFGDYTGRKWEKASSYLSLLDDTYCMNYLSGVALKNAGFGAENISIQVFGSDYLVPYYPTLETGNYNVQTSDVRYQGTTDEIYSLRYYPFDYVKYGAFSPDLGEYKGAELAYRSFVRENYLYVPGSTRAYLEWIVKEQGFDRNDPDIVAKVAQYVQNAANYNLNFDPKLNIEDDVVVSFLRDYKEGICQHFASAATMLYRVLNIPARYTIGYAGEVIEEEWTEFYSLNAHAWVEIYIDGLGWVHVEATGSGPVFGEGGTSGNKPAVIHIKPADEVKKYDGTPIYAQSVVGATATDAYYFRELLGEGYTYRAEFSGSRTEIGESFSSIRSFEFYDPSGKQEKHIRFLFTYGKLKVVEENVVIVRPYSLQKYYDGTPLRYESYDYTVTGLPSSYKLSLSLSGIGLIGAGALVESDFRGLPYKIFNEAGLDVTDRFYLVYEAENALMVNRRRITITTASDEKVYDGMPLKNKGYRISVGSLAQGDQINVIVSGTITDIGKTQNYIKSVKISDALGSDVTKNYLISFNLGTLEVIDG